MTVKLNSRRMLRAIIAAVEQGSLTGMSRVNKGLTKQQAFDILSYDGGEPDDRKMPIHIARNILREFSLTVT